MREIAETFVTWQVIASAFYGPVTDIINYIAGLF